MKLPLQILLLCLIGFSSLATPENHPTGARAAALSNAVVSLPDCWSTFHNQATLTAFNKNTLGIFHGSRFLIDELQLTAGSFILPTNSGNFGLSFYQFGKGNYKEQKFGLAFARRLSEKLSAAIQLDYFSNRFPEKSEASGFATFELGVVYQFSQQISGGIHLFNPIENGFEVYNRIQKIPATLRLGGHYQFSPQLLLAAESEFSSEHSPLVKTGIEFSPLKSLAFRLGISGKPVQYSAGIGYSIKNFTTDFGFTFHQWLGVSPSISVQFQFP